MILFIHQKNMVMTCPQKSALPSRGLRKYSHFTGKCNTLRHWSSLYPLSEQGLQVKANVANLFEMTINSEA